ncbi:RimK/LysX family protein [Vibrio chagasii]|nr:RimK/LysX family protein [Vibrio chagasii]
MVTDSGEEEGICSRFEEALVPRVFITGAVTTSSISAVDIVDLRSDEKDWVKFKIEHDGILHNRRDRGLPVERCEDQTI